MGARPLIADDFAEIRAARDELARQRDAAIAGPPAPLTSADVDSLRAVFEGEGDPLPAGPMSPLTPDQDPSPCACRPAQHRECDRWDCVDLSLGPRGWTGVVAGYAIGPFRSLSFALRFARLMRDSSLWRAER